MIEYLKQFKWYLIHPNSIHISDNLRLLGAAVKLADNEDDINSTVIALDTQKDFDSVNHEYIITLLKKLDYTTWYHYSNYYTKI